MITPFMYFFITCWQQQRWYSLFETLISPPFCLLDFPSQRTGTARLPWSAAQATDRA